MRVRGSLGVLAVVSLLGTLPSLTTVELRSLQVEGYGLIFWGERCIAETVVK